MGEEEGLSLFVRAGSRTCTYEYHLLSGSAGQNMGTWAH